MHHTFTMKSLLILIILLTAATVSLCRRPEKKEKFVIVVKSNDDKNSTSTIVEAKHTNTTRLENISLDYNPDIKKFNKTEEVAKTMYKFEAKDGRIYKRGKSILEEVTQEPNNSNNNHVLSLPPKEFEQQPLEEPLPENPNMYEPNSYMAFKLCPVPLKNVITDTNDQGSIHYVPQPYLYQASSRTEYRVPKKMVIRYKPILEAVEDSSENSESNSYDEVLPANYGPISGNGFMVVYPNGMAKMVEPMNNGLAGNDLKSEPTGFSNDGIYYHDGLKEYEFQMEDKPVIADDRGRIGKAILYVNSESFKDYIHGMNDEYQENTENSPRVNTYDPNALNSNAYQYTQGYNQEHSGFSNTQGWPLRNENLYGRNMIPTASVNYEYNTATVTDLLPSENTMSESNVHYTPSLDNNYDNSNVVRYNTNTNQYQAKTNNDYGQQNYEFPANHNHQYNDAIGPNVGVSSQNYNHYSNVNTQNILHNHNLNSATPSYTYPTKQYKRTAACGTPTV